MQSTEPKSSGTRRIRAVLPILLVLSTVFQTGCAQLAQMLTRLVANGPVNPNAAGGGGNLLAAATQGAGAAAGAANPAALIPGANNQVGPLGLPRNPVTNATANVRAPTGGNNVVTPPAGNNVVTPPAGNNVITPPAGNNVRPANTNGVLMVNDTTGGQTGNAPLTGTQRADLQPILA